MFFKKLLLVSIITLTALGITSCGTKPQPKEQSTQTSTLQQQSSQSSNLTYIISTGSEKGTFYPVGEGIIAVNAKNSVKLEHLKSPGSVENVSNLVQNKAQFGIVQTVDIYDAYAGKGDYAGKENKNLKGIISVYPNAVHFVVTKASKISSIADLKGKDFGVGAVGTGTERNCRDVLSSYGIDYTNRKDLNPVMVSFDEDIKLMTEGRIVGAAFGGGVPFKAVQDAFDKLDVKVLDIEPDMAQKIIDNNPSYFLTTIKAGTYGPKQASDITTVGVENILACREDVPEDVVYNFVKNVYDNHNELITYHKVLENATLENALQGMNMPLHKGVIKYLQEKGIYVPEKLK